MKIVKCDFCGKEMTENEKYITVITKHEETMYGHTAEMIKEYDCCEKCAEEKGINF